MHCTAKRMIYVALALGGILSVGYLAFPETRGLVLAGAPFLLALICPIAMLLMMFMANGMGSEKNGVGPARPEESQSRVARGVAGAETSTSPR